MGIESQLSKTLQTTSSKAKHDMEDKPNQFNKYKQQFQTPTNAKHNSKLRHNDVIFNYNNLGAVQNMH